MIVYQAKSYSEMCKKAADMISAQIILNPNSVLGLATGSTPIGVYERLADAYSRGELDFSGITTFNLDEYCGISENDPQSYHYYMNEHLFSKVNITGAYLPKGNAIDMEAECRRYEELITSVGGIDLQLLGIGNNGHIGFNEPNTEFARSTHCVTLDADTISANSRFFDDYNDVPRKAITMGIKTIMSAGRILLIANGAAKADILQKALQGAITPSVPASILQLHSNLTVIYSEN